MIPKPNQASEVSGLFSVGSVSSSQASASFSFSHHNASLNPFFIICIGVLPLTMLVQNFGKGAEISFCRFRLFQSLQNDLLQFAVVGTLHAEDGCFDVGVQARRALCQCLAVVYGFVAVIHSDKVEEQAGDASVEFVKRM